MMLAKLRIFNIAMTSICAVFFLFLIGFIALAPGAFDRQVRAYAIDKVGERVESKLQSNRLSPKVREVLERGGATAQKLRERAMQFKAKLASGRAELISRLIAIKCKLSCDTRNLVRDFIAQAYKQEIVRSKLALGRLKAFAVGQFDEIMSGLRRELLIFCGSTLAVLVVALLLAIFKRAAAAHLVPLSSLLSLSAIAAAVWYVFGQNWVLTVLFADYWGWAYPVFLGSISLLLADIALNKARVTSINLNVLSSAVGSTGNFTPC